MMSLNPTPLTEAKKWSLKKKTFKLPRKSNQSWDSWTSNCHEIIRTNKFSAIPSSEPKSQPSSSIKPFWSSIHHSYGFKPLKSIPHFWTKYFILELSCKYWHLKNLILKMVNPLEKNSKKRHFKGVSWKMWSFIFT